MLCFPLSRFSKHKVAAANMNPTACMGAPTLDNFIFMCESIPYAYNAQKWLDFNSCS